MTLRLLFLTAAIGAFAVPASAAPDGAKTSICHRTGPKPVQVGSLSLFRGHVITVSDSAVASHVSQHRDVVVAAAAAAVLRSGAVCHTDATGNLYDGAGRLVQAVPGTGGSGGWTDEGPG